MVGLDPGPLRPGILLATLAVACGGRQAPLPPPAPSHAAAESAGQEVSVAGRVAVLGHTPFEKVMVLPDDRRASGVEVVGDLRGEVRAAAGAQVAVRGTIESPGRMRVADYEILSIAGRKPLVGTLEARDDDLYLRVEGGPRTVRLESPPDGLRRPGAKAWVIVDDGGTVKAFAILKEPAP